MKYGLEQLATTHPILINGNAYTKFSPDDLTNPQAYNGAEAQALDVGTYFSDHWLPQGIAQPQRDGHYEVQAKAEGGLPELALFASYVALRDQTEVTLTYKNHSHQVPVMDRHGAWGDPEVFLTSERLFPQQVVISDLQVIERGGLLLSEKMLIVAKAAQLIAGHYAK